MSPIENTPVVNVAPVPIQWNPDISVYASETFLKTVGDQYGWLGGTDKTGKLRCVLPYTIVRRAIFRMVRFRVETIPWGDDLDLREEKAFLNSAVNYFRSIGADMIIPATTNTIFRTYPDGATAAPYGTHIVDLSQTEESLFSGLNSSHRRKVRLAAKGAVQIRAGLEHIESAYTLVRDTFKRSSLPFMGLAAFRRTVLGLGENVRIFVAEHDGAIQGAIVVPFSRHTAYYVYGGSIPEPAPGAMNILHWEAMRHFKNLGTRRYDFVGVRINPEKGSKQEGLLQFKERFGGTLVQGYMWKYPLHSLKYWLYGWAARLRTGGDIVDQERNRLAGRERTEKTAETEPLMADASVE